MQNTFSSCLTDKAILLNQKTYWHMKTFIEWICHWVFKIIFFCYAIYTASKSCQLLWELKLPQLNGFSIVTLSSEESALGSFPRFALCTRPAAAIILWKAESQERNEEDIQRWPGQKHDLIKINFKQGKKRKKKKHKPLLNARPGYNVSITFISNLYLINNVLLSPAVVSKAAK